MKLEEQIKSLEDKINLISSEKEYEISKLQSELYEYKNKLNRIKTLQNMIKNIDEIVIPLIKENTKWNIWDNSLTSRKYHDYGSLRDYKGNRYDERKGGWRNIESDIGKIDIDLKIQMLEQQKERYLIELKELLVAQ